MVVLVPFTGGPALPIGFIHGGPGPSRRGTLVSGAGDKEGDMAANGLEVIREMVERTNAHDLEGMAALIHKDYQSEQPFHPARGFGGRAQMKANWGAILTARGSP